MDTIVTAVVILMKTMLGVAELQIIYALFVHLTDVPTGITYNLTVMAHLISVTDVGTAM